MARAVQRPRVPGPRIDIEGLGKVFDDDEDVVIIVELPGGFRKAVAPSEDDIVDVRPFGNGLAVVTVVRPDGRKEVFVTPRLWITNEAPAELRGAWRWGAPS